MNGPCHGLPPSLFVNHSYRFMIDMDSKITRLIEQAAVIVGSLPFLQAYRDKTFLIKFGGSAMDAAKIMWVLYEHPDADFLDMAMRFCDIRKRTYTFPRMGEKAAAMGSSFHPIRPNGSEPGFDFAENIALALAVCEHLGVDRQTALSGMAHFKRDPYALTVHRMGEGLFVNGLSINDVQSTCTVWRDLKGKLGCRRLILLVNNRADRGSRTQDMLAVCCELCPDAVWLTGASQGFMARSLAKKLPGTPVERFARPELLPLDGLAPGEVVFAVGNIAQGGRDIIARVRQEGTLYVQ